MAEVKIQGNKFDRPPLDKDEHIKGYLKQLKFLMDYKLINDAEIRYTKLESHISSHMKMIEIQMI